MGNKIFNPSIDFLNRQGYKDYKDRYVEDYISIAVLDGELVWICVSEIIILRKQSTLYNYEVLLY